MSDWVIILHGLGRSAASMRRMAHAASAAGFTPLCPDYPSHRDDLATLARQLAPLLPETGLVHFIGHSLGGILALRLAEMLPAARRGRIVQLGAPNLGSSLAKRSAMLAPVLGPALLELTREQPKPDPALCIGAIAGTAALPLYDVLTGLKGPNDGKVSLTSAFGHARHCLALKLTHFKMMDSPEAIAASIRFLQQGRF
tara:strand:+ start:354 stop:950 length:597 start_codon:yes stop_codon:yes gene_type:complete